MEAKIKALADQMGVTPEDVRVFVTCLRVWTDKGLSLEGAIERHMQQMTRLAERSHVMPREFAAELYDDLRAVGKGKAASLALAAG